MAMTITVMMVVMMLLALLLPEKLIPGGPWPAQGHFTWCHQRILQMVSHMQESRATVRVCLANTWRETRNLVPSCVRDCLSASWRIFIFASLKCRRAAATEWQVLQWLPLPHSLYRPTRKETILKTQTVKMGLIAWLAEPSETRFLDSLLGSSTAHAGVLV